MRTASTSARTAARPVTEGRAPVEPRVDPVVETEGLAEVSCRELGRREVVAPSPFVRVLEAGPPPGRRACWLAVRDPSARPPPREVGRSGPRRRGDIAQCAEVGRADAPAYRAAASSSSSIDRKSTRLNSSHVAISYAVFCLNKKNIT